MTDTMWEHVEPHHESWLYRNHTPGSPWRRTLGGVYQPEPGAEWVAWVNTPDRRKLIGSAARKKEAQQVVADWWARWLD